MDQAGLSSLQLAGISWSLWEDSCVFTSACKLFQVKAKHIFGQCKLRDKEQESNKTDHHYCESSNCPHDEAYYSEDPSELVNQEHAMSHLQVYRDQYDSLQHYYLESWE